MSVSTSSARGASGVGFVFAMSLSTPASSTACGGTLTAASSTVGWDLQHGETDLAANIIKCMQDIGKEFGGPRQYLQARWGGPDPAETAARQTEFYGALMELLPLDDTVVYQASANMKQLEEKEISMNLPLAFHPAQFAFDEFCSLKPPPEAHVANLLAEQIVMDGFSTATEPLMLAPYQSIPQHFGPPICADTRELSIDAFSITYIKGCARLTALLAMLSLFVDDRVNLRAVAWPVCFIDFARNR